MFTWNTYFLVNQVCSYGLFFRDHIFNIIGAFDIPRFVYSSERKKFLP